MQAKRKKQITLPLPIFNSKLISGKAFLQLPLKLGKYYSKEILHFGSKLLILTANIFLAFVFVGRHFKYRNISFKYLGETSVWNFNNKSFISREMLPNRNMCKNACTVMLLETLDKNTVIITERFCTYFPNISVTSVLRILPFVHATILTTAQ